MFDALLVIDVQNDFCPGGALPVPDGDQVVGPINRLVRQAEAREKLILFSCCWHPAITTHFKDHGGIWPTHCVQSTQGAAFHPDLYVPITARTIAKGMGRNEDAYSATEGYLWFGGDWVTLEFVLRTLKVRKIVCVGLATDHCVAATALKLRELGFEVVVIEDACRGVELNPGDTATAFKNMKDAGVVVTTSNKIIH